MSTEITSGSIIAAAIIAVIWLILLKLTKKAALPAWHFVAGSAGLFVLMMLLVRPVATMPLARAVCALAGLIGRIGNTFTAYFKFSIVYIPVADGGMTLLVDLECSGVIELMAFFSLLLFFNVYTAAEKAVVGIASFCYIMIANALRITLICLIVHFFGQGAYGVAHAFIGRIFFYLLSIYLYFMVFTKPQVIKMRIGSFTYDRSKSDS